MSLCTTFRATAATRHRLTSTAAAVLGLMLTSSQAHAAYYDFSGSVNTFPTNVFPIDPGIAALDLGPATFLSVGNGGAGSFSALAGAQFSAGGVSVADGQGTGTATFTGAGTVAVLSGSTGAVRLSVGNWGTGTLTVSGGALIDAAQNAAGCDTTNPAFCSSGVGGGAGSTGTLNITGAGSEVRTVRNFTVGDVGVYNNYGTPGATTNAFVNVLAGGTLRTESTSLGIGPNGPLALGTERSFATAVVDGVGSQWVVTRNSVDNTAAFMGIGTATNATGSLTVSGGGSLRVDGTGSAGPNDGIGVGNAGKGTLIVTGTGSSLQMTGVNTFINVGVNTATADGTFQVLAGATASMLYANVGRGGGHGVLLIDGANSSLNLVGVGTVNATNTGGPAAISIGRLGGTGTATVSNGGRLFISDGGADGRPSTFSPGLSVGYAQGVAGSNGSLTIDGTGSTVEVVSGTLGLAAGTPDNYNPFVGVGRDTGSTGTLTVRNGGKLQLTGNAVSTVADSRSTTFQVGGTSDTVAGGTGTAFISGPGSEVRVEGADSFVGVGRGGNGTLTMTDQALLVTLGVSIGRGAAGVGLLNMDHSTMSLSGQQTGTFLSGANLSVGLGGGTGTALIGNGSVVTISNTGSAGASFNLGGTSVFPLGNGQLTLSGASRIQITANPGLGSFNVGRDGTGTAILSSASVVDVSGGNAFVGRLAGGVGQLTLVGGSSVLADVMDIGGTSDTVAGGFGTATVSGAGSALSLSGPNGFLAVGRFGGTGSLTVSNGGTVSAIVANIGRGVGASGTFSLSAGVLALSGEQTAGSTPVGASLAVGNRGGTGAALIGNGSVVTISNPGSLGASLYVGGTPLSPLGTGTLNVSGGSQVTLSAAPGLGTVRIGHDGNGTASFSGGSTLTVTGNDVIIAGQPGSTGTLTLNSGSTLTANYVGVGSNPGGIDGGTGFLFVNNSTVTANTVEIGSHSLLGGNGGVIHANVINRGILSPGNSPGHVVIDGAFNSETGSKIVLDVQSLTGGGYLVDELALTQATTFSLNGVAVVFNFLGNTDPVAAASSGALALDTFLRSTDGTTETGLSTRFTAGQTWNTLLANATFSATSSAYDVTSLVLNTDGSGTFTVTATSVVPEPAAGLLLMLGLLGVVGASRAARHRAA